ncbi:hypothetical protein [Acetivibrio straminisolvens]|uniref:Uncharacterized protein n=1 Tax=Acetivibrio straminisolvens JCM 21531 TaxID=1294263 RepID=W4V991_9FIRM|nr:hypothetical protein [Acetivibrio straminisolvens]GAE89746.1 hypothetical protein JCM21531_3302 [Acetivibrio straminisolvens JCM 21531]
MKIYKKIAITLVLVGVVTIAGSFCYSHITGNANENNSEINMGGSIKSSFKIEIEPMSVSASSMGDEIDWLNESDLIVRLKITDLDSTKYLEDSFFGEVEYKIFNVEVLETYKGKCPKDLKIGLSQLSFSSDEAVSDIVMGEEYILHLMKTLTHGENVYNVKTNKAYVYKLIKDGKNDSEKIFMRESSENPHYSELGLKEELTLKEYKNVIKSIIKKDRGTKEELEKILIKPSEKDLSE